MTVAFYDTHKPLIPNPKSIKYWTLRLSPQLGCRDKGHELNFTIWPPNSLLCLKQNIPSSHKSTKWGLRISSRTSDPKNIQRKIYIYFNSAALFWISLKKVLFRLSTQYGYIYLISEVIKSFEFKGNNRRIS